MYKNLKIPAVELGERKLTRVQENFSLQNNIFFKWIPALENFKNQETNRIKSKKINRTLKLCTLATNNLILS